MELNLVEQKQRFLDICRSTIHRDGLDSLLDWLCKVDFFQAPASTKYHGAYTTAEAIRAGFKTQVGYDKNGAIQFDL